MPQQDFQVWYDNLHKPSWTPSPDVIGLIWAILYPIILAVLVVVIYKVSTRQVPRRILLPFGLNILCNITFTPIQFGLRNLELAAADLVLVWVTIIWSMIVIWRYSRLLALAFAPYLVWVTLAGVLQLAISMQN